MVSPDYHIVRHRQSSTIHSWRTVEKNTGVELGRSLPNFKFEKQTPRKFEVADAHEMRFVLIDRANTVMSGNKKIKSLLNLEKSPERDFSHMINENMFKNDYHVVESLTSKRPSGFVSMGRQSGRDPCFGPRQSKVNLILQSETGLTSYDPSRAVEQRLKLKLKPKSVIPFYKQTDRPNIFTNSSSKR